jgi:hypothetical protein
MCALQFLACLSTVAFCQNFRFKMDGTVSSDM